MNVQQKKSPQKRPAKATQRSAKPQTQRRGNPDASPRADKSIELRLQALERRRESPYSRITEVVSRVDNHRRTSPASFFMPLAPDHKSVIIKDTQSVVTGATHSELIVLFHPYRAESGVWVFANIDDEWALVKQFRGRNWNKLSDEGATYSTLFSQLVVSASGGTNHAPSCLADYRVLPQRLTLRSVLDDFEGAPSYENMGSATQLDISKHPLAASWSCAAHGQAKNRHFTNEFSTSTESALTAVAAYDHDEMITIADHYSITSTTLTNAADPVTNGELLWEFDLPYFPSAVDVLVQIEFQVSKAGTTKFAIAVVGFEEDKSSGTETVLQTQHWNEGDTGTNIAVSTSGMLVMPPTAAAKGRMLTRVQLFVSDDNASVFSSASLNARISVPAPFGDAEGMQAVNITTPAEETVSIGCAYHVSTPSRDDNTAGNVQTNFMSKEDLALYQQVVLNSPERFEALSLRDFGRGLIKGARGIKQGLAVANRFSGLLPTPLGAAINAADAVGQSFDF